MKIRMKRFLGMVVACAASVLFLAPESTAQTKPAISPWLSMFNDNRGGVLDNYHTFVAPQLQMQKEFAQQERQMQQQQAQINKALNPPKKRMGYSPSNGAGYRQYLHYYSGLPQGGPPYQGKR